jgi:geranylgeranyl diphosphate synthase, type I
VSAPPLEGDIVSHCATHHDDLGLTHFAHALERRLRSRLEAADEFGIDPTWAMAREVVNEFVLRPAKRVRPTLLAVGHACATGTVDAEVLLDFGVGLELLHAFMLVHDDVADRATTRRGGPALHLALGSGRTGEALAVVAGDHLYALALEAMLEAPGSKAATRHMLQVCRHTAAGQHLDLALMNEPLPKVRLMQALKVARLKTAKYGFVAPLVCGAMLGHGSVELIATLERVGWNAGLAYQLRDDLLGLFGCDAVTGKPGGGDYLEGKRTLPVLAAWTRADERGRQVLEDLWRSPSLERLPQARAEVERWGGLAVTERVIRRSTAAARRSMAELSHSAAASVLDGMLSAFGARQA